VSLLPSYSWLCSNMLSRYHLMMIFGGGEFLMEAMDISVIRDAVPEFDAAWLDFCRLFNASDAE